jgi:hypothetical protein
MKRTIPERVHGTLNGYNHHRCHCDRCRAVNRERTRAYLAANPEQRAKRRERAARYRAQAKKTARDRVLKSDDDS